MTSTRTNKVNIDMVIAATNTDDFVGFCIGCGEEAYGVEPDARNHVCESCGQPSVFGAEELLFMIVADGRDCPIEC